MHQTSAEAALTIINSKRLIAHGSASSSNPVA
jgi:hypothetical protein